jgi:hypothetical protein
MNPCSSAGFAGAIRGGGTEECAGRRATTVGRGAKPPSESCHAHRHKEATL